MRFAGVVMRGIGMLVVAAVAVAPVQAQAKPATKPAATGPGPGALRRDEARLRERPPDPPVDPWLDAQAESDLHQGESRATVPSCRSSRPRSTRWRRSIEQQSVVLSPTQRAGEAHGARDQAHGARDARAGTAAEGAAAGDRAARPDAARR